MRRQKAFTLIELLVVVTIIGLLCAVMAPSLSRARIQARRAACGQTLHGLGIGIQTYLNEFSEIYPMAAEMPSINTSIPALSLALASQISTPKAWNCPADRNGYLRNGNMPFDSYFAGETLSYEYNMSLGGKRLEQDFLYPVLGATGVFVLIDFDHFHEASTHPNSKNVLFGDGHVGTISDITKALGG